jgi:L-ornithine N5-oxygenase
VETCEPDTYDVVGIGFGPSNLALAIALEEEYGPDSPDPLTVAFFERQPSLSWHRGMLVPGAKMQVSFLKDLATFRDPTSKFSFVSYLHAMGRLPQFVNNQDFFPTRREFHDYLEWAESHLSDKVSYDSEVTGIRLPRPRTREPVEHVQVEVRNPALPGGTGLVNARNVVVSTGLVPRMPTGIARDESVWHSSEFLFKFDRCDLGALNRVAVVGAGQSAAEIARFVYDTVPHASISCIMPSYGYSIADDTPFANRVFDPGAVDNYYNGSGRSRDAIWRYHKNTNYSVVDDEVIRGLHRRVYDEDVKNTHRLDFVNLARVVGVEQVAGETRVTVHSLVDEKSHELSVDVLVCATGYDFMAVADLLGELEACCLRDAQGRYRVERDYRLATTPELRCGLYLQGGTEHTHGLSSSLLSNIAVRSGEIASSIAGRRVPAHRNGS